LEKRVAFDADHLSDCTPPYHHEAAPPSFLDLPLGMFPTTGYGVSLQDALKAQLKQVSLEEGARQKRF